MDWRKDPEFKSIDSPLRLFLFSSLYPEKLWRNVYKLPIWGTIPHKYFDSLHEMIIYATISVCWKMVSILPYNYTKIQ